MQIGLRDIKRSQGVDSGGTDGSIAVRGQPFNSDGPVGGLKTPPLGIKIKDSVYNRYDSKRPETYPPAVWLADRALTPLFRARAELLSRRGKGEEPWAAEVVTRVSQAGPAVPPGADERMAADSAQVNNDVLTLITQSEEMAERGEWFEALSHLNDCIREILNTRAVGVGHILPREDEMWKDMQVVLTLDPNFPKVKYNWACALARKYASNPEARATACRMVKEALVGAKSYGVQPGCFWVRRRRGMMIGLPFGNIPSSKPALREAELEITAQEQR